MVCTSQSINWRGMILAGTEVAEQQGAVRGRSGSVERRLLRQCARDGLAVAEEIEFTERPNDRSCFSLPIDFDPGAFNLPLYLAFADPMNTPGLMLAPDAEGFRFVIMDVNHTEGDRIIELSAPKELYEIAALLRDTERYVVESVWSVSSGDQAVVASTSRLHNIAGKYTVRTIP